MKICHYLKEKDNKFPGPSSVDALSSLSPKMSKDLCEKQNEKEKLCKRLHK